MENSNNEQGQDLNNSNQNVNGTVSEENQLNNYQPSADQLSSADHQGAQATQAASKSEPDEDDDNKKLFVGGLAHDITEDQLKKHFSQFGEITSVNIKSDLMTKRPRGFGFVTFSSCDPVTAALKASTHCINGKQIDPKKAKARPKPPPIKKIFVGGLHPDTAEFDVISYFERFGKVENVELPFDKTQNKRRAFCFVCFQEEKSALNAAAQPKQIVPPMTKPCDVKLATPPRVEGFGILPTSSGRGGRGGRYQGGYSGYGGLNYFGGYGGPNFTGASSGGFNQNYGGYGYGSGGYDYGYSNYGNSGYDANFWNYGQNNYGGGYGDSQGSDDYTRDTM
ncbi:Heterogeneous nuclear ribonucleoprotein D-like [Nymphon striatum]|nr:Heterogeneous nuclear ribonucleoprotein D-like [Nymphon striatum]